MYSRFLILFVVQVALCEISDWNVHTNVTVVTDGKRDQILSPKNVSFIPLTSKNAAIDWNSSHTKLAANSPEIKRYVLPIEIPITTITPAPPSPPSRRYGVFYGIVILKIVLLCFYLFVKCSKPAPVIVTTTSTTAGQYPVSVHPTPGGGLQATPYPMSGTHMAMPQPQMMATNPPYPTHGGAMPQPYGQEAGYPNPPYPTTDPSRMNPPSYDQVVSGGTQKQAPYNPHYMGN